MLRDLTIGQYYETKSKIHRLDPRVKLFGTLCYMLAIFMAQNVIGYILSAVFLILVINISNVPFRYIAKGLKSIVILIIFSSIFSLFFTDGRVILDLYICDITIEGIIMCIKLASRLAMMIMGASIMTYTTTPTDIADGLEKSFSPLKKVKVPVHDIAMMVSIAFRFIPILVEETDKIMKAQIARGADFEAKGLVKKAKAMVPLIVPLIVSSIKRALDLATAMEARCYRGGDGRTKMKPLRYKKYDAVAYVLLFVHFGVVIGSNFLYNIIMDISV